MDSREGNSILEIQYQQFLKMDQKTEVEISPLKKKIPQGMIL